MKRSLELRELSVEHHQGLVQARRLRRLAEGEGEVAGVVREFLRAWELEIQPHFRLEEEILLPAYAAQVPPDSALILRTLTEHVALRRAVRELRDAPAGEGLELAVALGRALDEHIRFEERVLFPAVEAELTGPGLERVGREILAAAGELSSTCGLQPAEASTARES